MPSLLKSDLLATTLQVAEIGPGYVIESVEGASDSYPAVRVAQAFEHRFNDVVRVWESIKYVPEISDFNQFIIDAEAGIETTITDRFSLKTYVQDRYDNVPAPGRSANDVIVVSALSWKL